VDSGPFSLRRFADKPAKWITSEYPTTHPLSSQPTGRVPVPCDRVPRFAARTRRSWQPQVLEQHDAASPLLPVHDYGFAVGRPRRAKYQEEVRGKLNGQTPLTRFGIDDPDGIAGSGAEPLPIGAPNRRDQSRSLNLRQDLARGRVGDFYGNRRLSSLSRIALQRLSVVGDPAPVG